MAVRRKNGELPKNGVNITNINVRVPNRSTQDIETWRRAIAAFENPTNPVRTYLYDLYKDMELDGQVEATWGKRCDAILNKRLVFKRVKVLIIVLPALFVLCHLMIPPDLRVEEDFVGEIRRAAHEVIRAKARLAVQGAPKEIMAAP